MVDGKRLQAEPPVLAASPGEAEAARRTAFERLTQSRLDRAYRLAGLLLRDSYEAEDAVHEAALQAWRHWRELRDPARVYVWFDRIVVNECRAMMRRRRLRPLPTAAAMPDWSSSDASGGFEERDALRRAAATLDADHRIVVVLRFVENLTPAEIAERTGVREGTVKSRLHYALREMRAAYEAAERLPGGA